MNGGQYDVIVVGGGPAGLSAGIVLAKNGIAALIIEQKNEVGLPMQCGEAVGQLFMEESGFAPDLPWVLSPVNRLKMVMPNGTYFILPGRGYCIRRDVFDRWLFDEYVRLGGKAHLGEKVIGAEESHEGIRLRTAKGVYTSDYLIAADGPLSRLALSLGLRRKAKCLSAIQYKFRSRGGYEAGTLSFYFTGEIADGYFWIFPRGEEISVGVGGSDPRILRDALGGFCRRHGFDPSGRLSSHGGLVPDSWAAGKLLSERVIICGAAAGLVHPASKAGIHLAIHSGRLAGRAVAEKVRDGTPLSLYAEEIGRIEGFRQPYFDRLRSALRFTDREYNLIGEMSQGSTPGKLPIGRILLRPSVWPILPRLLGIYMAYNRTARRIG